MLTEETIVGKIEVLPSGVIQVREDTIVYRDGVKIAHTYHRNTFEPGADVAGHPPTVRAVAGVLWTPDVIKARADFLAAGLAKLEK